MGDKGNVASNKKVGQYILFGSLKSMGGEIGRDISAPDIPFIWFILFLMRSLRC